MDRNDIVEEPPPQAEAAYKPAKARRKQAVEQAKTAAKRSVRTSAWGTHRRSSADGTRLPRVFVLPDAAGYQPGTSLQTRGPRFSSYLFGVHCFSQDTGAPMIPVIFDAINKRYRTNSTADADLFFGFVPLPVWPPPANASIDPQFMRPFCARMQQTVLRLAKVVGVRSSTLDNLPRRILLEDLSRLKNAFVLTPVIPGMQAGKGLVDETCRSFGFGRAIELTLTFNADQPQHTKRPAADSVRVHKAPIPFMSNIRWSTELVRNPPWQLDATRARPVLMSFVGSVGDPGTPRYAVRSAMMRGCTAAGPHVCEMIDFESGSGCQGIPEHLEEDDVRSFRCIRRVFALKARSVFCLEPPGNSPGRKSIIDSILSGCVPVLLQDEHMSTHFDSYLPWHFGWRRNASIVYSAHKLISSSLRFETIVADLVRSNATGAVFALQQTISERGHNLVYGIDGHYRDDDAVGLMLRGLVEWQRGLAGGHMTDRYLKVHLEL